MASGKLCTLAAVPAHLPTCPPFAGAADHNGGMTNRGPSTRAVHAGLPPPAQGEPMLPGPVPAGPYHLRGAADSAPYGYGRDANPTWTHLENALGELDGGEAVVFSSGMAAVSAVVLPRLSPGDVLVAPRDGYPGIRKIAENDLAPRGVEVRFVPTHTHAIVAAAPGATLVCVETPSNPRLDTCDLRAVVEAAHAAGARVAVDNTVATPLGLRPLDYGADFAMMSGTKSLSGHSDVLLGAVSVRDAELAAELRAWRSRTGAVLGPFEAWLAHRSLATLGLRLERAETNARALTEALAGRDDVTGVRWPGVGAVIAFTLAGAERAQAFLDACELVSEATSFGGVHSTAERRGRWGTDDVPDGFIRFSAGCEDTADLVADVLKALGESEGPA
jgi:cystathionine gamma-lyase